MSLLENRVNFNSLFCIRTQSTVSMWGHCPGRSVHWDGKMKSDSWQCESLTAVEFNQRMQYNQGFHHGPADNRRAQSPWQWPSSFCHFVTMQRVWVVHGGLDLCNMMSICWYYHVCVCVCVCVLPPCDAIWCGYEAEGLEGSNEIPVSPALILSELCMKICGRSWEGQEMALWGTPPLRCLHLLLAPFFSPTPLTSDSLFLLSLSLFLVTSFVFICVFQQHLASLTGIKILHSNEWKKKQSQKNRVIKAKSNKKRVWWNVSGEVL